MPDKCASEFASVFQTVTSLTKEIKQLCDWDLMVCSYNKPKEKLIKCKTHAKKFMALMDYIDKLDSY